MQTKVIILVTDRGDDRHGEISVVDDLEKAERLIEAVIQAGFEQERIRVFTGSELGLRVSLRPVVTLASSDEAPEGGTEARVEGQEPAQEEAPVDEKDIAPAPQPTFRFSSLFRSE